MPCFLNVKDFFCIYWLPWYSWNIAQSGIKHQKINQSMYILKKNRCIGHCIKPLQKTKIFFPIQLLNAMVQPLPLPQEVQGWAIVWKSVYGRGAKCYTEWWRGRHGRDRMVVGFTTAYAIRMLWVWISNRARCTTLCDKVCQWLVTGLWFSPGPPLSTNKTDGHGITEILLEVALNTIKQTTKQNDE